MSDIALYGVRELVFQMDYAGLGPGEKRVRLQALVEHYSLFHDLVGAGTGARTTAPSAEEAGFPRAVLIPELRRRILAIRSDRGGAAAKKGAYAEVILLIEEHLRVNALPSTAGNGGDVEAANRHGQSPGECAGQNVVAATGQVD